MAKIEKNKTKSEQNKNRVKFHRAVNQIIRNDNDSTYGNHRQSDNTDHLQGINESLRQWALEYNITRRALTALLKLLILYGMNTLPCDSRTLLSTPRTVELFPLTNGQFWYDF